MFRDFLRPRAQKVGTNLGPKPVEKSVFSAGVLKQSQSNHLSDLTHG
jgi:hypothetical protein